MNLPAVLPVTAGDINIYHARLIADQQITYVVEFSESLDLDRLSTALAVLHQSVPILSFTIQIKSSHFKRTRIPRYQPVVTVVNEPTDRQQEIVHFTGTPCNPEMEAPP